MAEQNIDLGIATPQQQLQLARILRTGSSMVPSRTEPYPTVLSERRKFQSSSLIRRQNSSQGLTRSIEQFVGERGRSSSTLPPLRRAISGESVQGAIESRQLLRTVALENRSVASYGLVPQISPFNLQSALRGQIVDESRIQRIEGTEPVSLDTDKQLQQVQTAVATLQGSLARSMRDVERDSEESRSVYGRELSALQRRLEDDKQKSEMVTLQTNINLDRFLSSQLKEQQMAQAHKDFELRQELSRINQAMQDSKLQEAALAKQYELEIQEWKYRVSALESKLTLPDIREKTNDSQYETDAAAIMSPPLMRFGALTTAVLEGKDDVKESLQDPEDWHSDDGSQLSYDDTSDETGSKYHLNVIGPSAKGKGKAEDREELLPDDFPNPYDYALEDRLDITPYKITAKLPDLPKFNGEVASNVDKWISRCERLLADALVSKTRWSLALLKHMEGTALGWYEAYADQAGDNLTWPVFKKDLKIRYSYVNKSLHVRQELEQLKFDNVDAFISKIRNIAMTAPVGEFSTNDWVERIFNKLPGKYENYKVKIFEDMQEGKSVDLAYMLRKLETTELLRMAARSTHTTTSEPRSNTASGSNRGGTPRGRGGSFYRGYGRGGRGGQTNRPPAQIQSASTTTTVSRAENVCFSCGSPDHYSPDCPTKGQGNKAPSRGNAPGGRGGYRGNRGRGGYQPRVNIMKITGRTAHLPTLMAKLGQFRNDKFRRLPVRILVDTGASQSYVSQGFVKAWETTHCRTLIKQMVDAEEVMSATGVVGLVTETVDLTFEFGSKIQRSDIFVIIPFVEKHFDCILGWPWLQENAATISLDRSAPFITLRDSQEQVQIAVQFGERTGEGAIAFKPRLNNLKQREKISLKTEPYRWYQREASDLRHEIPVTDEEFSTWLEASLKERFPYLFSNELSVKPNRSPMNIMHTIKTVSDAYIQVPPRQYLPQLRQTFEEFIKEGLKNKLIRRSASPYSSPALTVRKKDGTQRVVMDYRAINAITVPDSFPMTRADDAVEQTVGARYYTSLDLLSAFWQIMMDKKSIPLTAFTTPEGLFEWLRMPMGLCNAPATFQRAIQRVLQEFITRFVIVYQDDVTVYSNTKEEHVAQVMTVCKLLDQSGFVLGLNKCHFGKRSALILGHHVSEKGLSPNNDKVKAISSLSYPETVSGVRSFLNMAGYYRRFIKDFARKAGPLYELTKGDLKPGTPITFTREARLSMDHLKNCLTAAPLLAAPQTERRYYIESDASQFAMGAVLSQITKGKHFTGKGVPPKTLLQPIAYFSRRLRKEQLNYSAQQRELLAALTGCEKFKHYIQGCPGGVTIITDHESLKYLRHQREVPPRLEKYIEIIEQYSPQFLYRAGKDNVVADYLSRQTDLPEPPTAQEGILQLNTDAISDNHMVYFDDDDCYNNSVHIIMRLNADGVDDLEEELSQASANESIGDEQRIGIDEEASEVFANEVGEEAPGLEQAIDRITRGAPESIGILRTQFSIFRLLRLHLDPTRIFSLNAPEFTDEMMTEARDRALMDGVDIDDIISRVRRKESLVELQDGIMLYRVDEGVFPVVTDLNEAASMAIAFHQDIGHKALDATIQAIKDRYFLPSTKILATAAIATCTVCKVYDNTKRPLTLLHPIGRVDAFDRWGLDFVPMPSTERGNTAMITAIDYCTSQAHANPVKEQNSESAVALMQELIFCYGKPSSIICDNANAFASELFMDFMDKLAIIIRFTATYHPQTNGKVEKFNGIITKALEKLSLSNDRDWDQPEILGTALLGYRATRSSVTGCSPFYLMYGREPRLILQPALETRLRAFRPSRLLALGTRQARVRRFEEVRGRASQRAQDHMRNRAIARENEVLSGNTEDAEITTGDWVLLQNTCLRNAKGKFLPKWLGPFIVSNITDDGAVELYSKLGTLQQTVNIDQIKLAPGAEDYPNDRWNKPLPFAQSSVPLGAYGDALNYGRTSAIDTQSQRTRQSTTGITGRAQWLRENNAMQTPSMIAPNQTQIEEEQLTPQQQQRLQRAQEQLNQPSIPVRRR